MKLRTIQQEPEGTGEGTVGRRVFRNYYKGHKDKTKGEGGSKGGRVCMGRKCR